MGRRGQLVVLWRGGVAERGVVGGGSGGERGEGE